jgi:hypothetical protein
LIYAEKVGHGFFYSAAPPLDNSRYRFANVALAATGEVGLLGNARSMFSPSAPIEAISLQGRLDLVANSDSSFLFAPPS